MQVVAGELRVMYDVSQREMGSHSEIVARPQATDQKLDLARATQEGLWLVGKRGGPLGMDPPPSIQLGIWHLRPQTARRD